MVSIMKNFLAFLFLISLPIISSSQVVTATFDFPLWEEGFEVPTTRWKQSSNNEELFVIQNGAYYLHRKNKNSGSNLIPQGIDEIGSFKVEMSLEFLSENDKNSSAGLIFMAQNTNNGAFLIEINTKQSFRISKYNGISYFPFTNDGFEAGWLSSELIKPKGRNIITVLGKDKKYDLYINNSFAYSFYDLSYSKGKIGVYIGPATNISIDAIQVFGEKEGNLALDSGNTAQKAFTEVIVSLRTTVSKQNKEIDSLQKIIFALKKKESAEAKNPQSIPNLKKEIDNLKKQLNDKNKLIAALKNENTNLKKYKDAIAQSGDKDVVLNLTKIIEDQRVKIDALEAEILELKASIEKLNELIPQE